ncbi:MAG TPA: FAD-dependent oxidoreductase [Methylovirgula sp.]|nr:FAD-dependent oxidoreductase [Methylovirgula sp.]
MSETIVIIGAGHAGAQLVDSLRSGGYAGRLVLIGDEIHRPYDRPLTSKGLLSGEVEIERAYLKRDSYYPDKNIELMLGRRASKIDRAARTVVLDDARTVDYDKLVIATGARARRLDLPGATLDGIFYLRSLADSLAIGKRLVPGARLMVIGGGYVGLEVAASAIKLGCRVSVVEVLERLLARVAGAEIADFYAAQHRAHGVDVKLGAGIERFLGKDRLEGVRLSNGEEIKVDVAVVGVGATPNIELASEAGLAVDNGISVDDCGRTSDPAIFAAGDATNHPNALLGRRLRLESVPAAMGQARAIASAILGDPKPYVEIPWFWSDQYDLKLQMVGLNEPGDHVVLRGDPAGRKFAAYYLRDGAVVAVNAVNSAKDFIGGRKLITEGKKPDLARLADPAIPLAEL